MEIGCIAQHFMFGEGSQRGEEMRSESKETRMQQQTLLEARLQKRLAMLADKGAQGKMIAKDALVKELKAKLKQTAMRLQAIDAVAKKTEELSARKAEPQEKPLKSKKDIEEKPAEPKPKKKTKAADQTSKG